MTARAAVGPGSILAGYGALICDLDGVVYTGARAVPGAVEALRSTLASGRAITFATNNASREPSVVEQHLRSLGVEPGPWCVVSSAQAAATYVLEQIGRSGPVLAVGGPGVAQALREVELNPFSAASARHQGPAAAVVQGAGTNVSWRDLAEVAHQVNAGALWVATNPDPTIPTGRGLAPGNGALVAAVRLAVDTDPVIVGKPQPMLYGRALQWLGMTSGDVLVIGDRLDTDIAAAHTAGLDSLFVLSGAHGLRDLVFCPRAARPTYVGLNLGAILAPPSDGAGPVGRVEDGVIRVDHPRCSPMELLESVVTGAWEALDSGTRLDPEHGDWQFLERRLRGGAG